MNRHPNPFSTAVQVPASPREQLHALMGDVVAAETALTSARRKYQAAVEKAGMPTAGIFGECEFITRLTGSAWRRDAWEMGRRAPNEDKEESDDHGGAGDTVDVIPCRRRIGMLDIWPGSKSKLGSFAQLAKDEEARHPSLNRPRPRFTSRIARCSMRKSPPVFPLDQRRQ